MKFNYENLFFSAVLLLAGFGTVGEENMQYHGDGPAMGWYVPYTLIVAGFIFLIGELNASRKRK